MRKRSRKTTSRKTSSRKASPKKASPKKVSRKVSPKKVSRNGSKKVSPKKVSRKASPKKGSPRITSMKMQTKSKSKSKKQPFQMVSYISQFSNTNGNINTYEKKVKSNPYETNIWINENGKITTKKIKHEDKPKGKNTVQLDNFMTLEDMGIRNPLNVDFFNKRYMYPPQIFS